MAGQFATYPTSDGVAVSSDSGRTWSLATVDGLHETGLLRYASEPDTATIYVTAGMWNSTDEVRPSPRAPFAAVRVSEEGKVSHETARAGDSEQGWWAQVAKSEDGGKTFTVVFESIDEGYYPNQIDCADADHCVFVMEGIGSPKVMTTTDGGSTWTEFLVDTKSTSLMAAKMVSTTEAWVAGGGDTGRMWHSTDLSNWEENTVDAGDAVSLTDFDIDADARVLYMTGVSRLQVCNMLKATY